MGKDWWNPKGKMAALHMINGIRFEYFKKNLGDLQGKKVLDVGCGGGLLSEQFAKEGALVTGVDPVSCCHRSGEDAASENNIDIDYRNCALEEIQEQDYDIVTCAEMLEHVDDLNQMIKDSTAKLKEGGYFLLKRLIKHLPPGFLQIFMAENVLNFVGRGTHDYDRFVKPSQLASLLSDNDVSVREIKGMTFKPLEWKFVISASTQVNYIGFGVKG